MSGKHILVSGRVQGVGYRAFTKKQADLLSITGWVRNCSSGDVEVQAYGSDEQLESFLSQLKKGPSLSQVDKLDVREVEVSTNYLQNDFVILPSDG